MATKKFTGFKCKKCGKKYLTHGYKDDLNICYDCHNNDKARKQEVSN